jgi:tagaturonate reductase
LLDITLNSTAKWKARVLPSLKGYVEKFGKLPPRLTASLAFYIAFFHGNKMEDGAFFGLRGQDEYPIKDDKEVLDFFWSHKDDDNATLAKAVLSNGDFWGEDLTAISGLLDAVADMLNQIDEKGAYEVMK